MDPKSWNEDYAEKILKRKGPSIPELSSIKRMMGVPTESDTKQKQPRKKPRNLGLLAWEKFHAAATPEAEVSVKVEISPSVIEAESAGGQNDCGRQFYHSRYVWGAKRNKLWQCLGLCTADLLSWLVLNKLN